MKSIELHLNCSTDEAIRIIKKATQDTGFLKTYSAIKGQFKGNQFKLWIKAPKQIMPSAYLVGSISSEGNASILQASLTNRAIFKVPKILLVVSAITFFCGGPYLAYLLFTLSANFGTTLAGVLISLLFLIAGIFGNISSFQQEELADFLPKVFTKYSKEPDYKMKADEN